jgi:hypothetical protein
MRLRTPPLLGNNPQLNNYLRDIKQTYGRILFMTPCWYQQNVAASQSSVALNLLGTTDNSEVVYPQTGRVIGISVSSNAARTAGTLTVSPVVNGTASTTLSVSLDGTNTQYNSALQGSAQNINDFTANQSIGVEITTDGSWAPTTADIVVNLFVDF